jgi:cellobiose phosphorylase
MPVSYGDFNADGSEFIITDPATPRAFDNFLWNNAVFSNVQQTGVGSCDYQVGSREAIQLLTGNGRVCDFDVFGRDNLMSRLIYVLDRDTGDYWNVNWEPVRRKYEKYECTHGLGYTVIRSQTDGIGSQFHIFVPAGSDPVELWKLNTVNRSPKARNLSLFFYNQFQFRYKWGFDSYGDMLFRCSRFSPELNAVVASKHPHIAPHEYLTGFLAADTEASAWDGTRDAFVGMYGTLREPQAVVRGRCSCTPGSSDATVGALQFDFTLAPGESKPIELILGATDGEEGVKALHAKYFGNFARYFEELAGMHAERQAKGRVKTPDAQLDRLLNHWLKQQCAFGAQWCRWGWMGYRDIVQHGMGVSSFDPGRTKAILLEALAHQYQSGLALRGWNPVDAKPYSDSALWLAFTLAAYLKETGDMGLLDTRVPYYDGGEASSVLGHIERALDFLEGHKGSHGLCLIKFGDWNDSLTAVGRLGRGESVWLSEAYAEAARQMAELFGYLGDVQKQNEYLVRYEGIKSAINEHAWDGNWYLRCFDDNGNPVGSHENAEGSIFIEAQAWAMIAGIADSDRTEKLLASCDRMLGTGMGYRLLAPVFTHRDDSIGRISCMEPGICENGTIYSHVNAWMILGILRSGQPDRAYASFQRVAPGYFASENDPKRRCPPYIFANCYYGPDHRNNPMQMEFTWITGSVSWLHQVLQNDLLGVRPSYCGLQVEPRIPAEWEGYEFTRAFRGAIYHIVVKNLHAGSPGITIDGKPVQGIILPVVGDGCPHEVEIEI